MARRANPVADLVSVDGAPLSQSADITETVSAALVRLVEALGEIAYDPNVFVRVRSGIATLCHDDTREFVRLVSSDTEKGDGDVMLCCEHEWVPCRGPFMNKHTLARFGIVDRWPSIVAALRQFLEAMPSGVQ